MAKAAAHVDPGDASGNLDVIRSMAVLFVVASHLPVLWSTLEGPSYHVGSLGLLGVVTFFVHTCLVLMMSLERQTATSGARGRTVAFFLRRGLRIYPLSVVVVLVTHALAPWFGHARPDLPGTLANLALVQNLTGHDSLPGPLWSLPFEVQMYLVLPLLFALLGRWGARAPRWLFALWLGSAAFVLVLYRLGVSYQLVKYVPCFLPGVLAYSLRGRPRRVPAWVLFALLGALTVGLPVAVARGARENVVTWPICLALGLLLPHCREVQAGWARAAGKTIAKYSYGIYLLHLPGIELVGEHLGGLPMIVRWGVWLAAVAGLTWLAYHVVERPGIQLGNRLAARWQRRAG